MAATRAIITIDTGNPKIGLVGFIAVGMCEVSTCEVTVKEQEVVKKGQQLGMFHFGGSSHAVIFGPEAKIKFDTAIEDAAGKVHVDKHIKVLSALAHVVQ
jgi:phosphatidylserine decarboxylase